MSQVPTPFSCTYTPQIPELLFRLRCTLALSTYQAGKVIFLSAKDEHQLIQLPRNFQKPMGIAQNGDQLAVATSHAVLVFKNHPSLAATYPAQPQTYDSLFMPRVSYNTGPVDLHDLVWKGNELYAVNTAFSCLIRVDDQFSFTPVWKPSFISTYGPGDHCHLNGLAVLDDELKFATAFSHTDTPQGWRENVTTSGVLIDIPSGEMISSSLAMPHSPRVFDGKLYLLLSATGEFVSVDQENGNITVIKKLNGFVRGLAKCGDYVFIGLSKLRRNSSTFARLPIAAFSDRCGIVVIHLPTAAIVGEIYYQASVEEIYDIHILAGLTRPGILTTDKPEHALGIATPQGSWWATNKEQSSQS